MVEGWVVLFVGGCGSVGWCWWGCCGGCFLFGLGLGEVGGYCGEGEEGEGCDEFYFGWCLNWKVLVEKSMGDGWWGSSVVYVCGFKGICWNRWVVVVGLLFMWLWVMDLISGFVLCYD